MTRRFDETWVSLYGAAIGDICGSIYEFNNRKTDRPEEIELINEACYFTDDTVLTAAIADALTSNDIAIRNIDRRFWSGKYRDDEASLLYSESLWNWGNRYPGRGYGGNFQQWLRDSERKTYGSYGNGAAMRISPIARRFCNSDYHGNITLAGLFNEVVLATATTHGHPEGIKGAQATALAIVLGHQGKTKDEIRNEIVTRFGYDLSRTLAEIRPDYGFDETCQGTVPVAITAFLESHDFVSAIQNAISVGGDSDTIAAITGSIAEAFYKEIPEDLKAFARSKLPGDILLALGIV
jgi:ADP-ribosylglycohydrolase